MTTLNSKIEVRRTEQVIHYMGDKSEHPYQAIVEGIAQNLSTNSKPDNNADNPFRFTFDKQEGVKCLGFVLQHYRQHHPANSSAGLEIHGMSFGKIKFIAIKLDALRFKNCYFKSCRFIDTHDSHEYHSFQTCKAHDCVFKQLNLRVASNPTVNFLELTQCKFSACEVGQVVPPESKLVLTDFDACRLEGLKLHNCDVQLCSFPYSKLAGCSIDRSHMEVVNFSHTVFSSDSRITNLAEPIHKDGIIFSKQSFDSLGASHGGLTPAELRFRQQYSGFWTFTHAVAVAIFLAPYAWFLSLIWSRANFLTETPTNESASGADGSITIIQALWNYLATGGKTYLPGGKTDWLALTLFGILFVINGIRLWLMYVAKKEEAIVETTDLPSSFSFGQRTFVRFFFRANQALLIVGIVIGFIKASIFFNARIDPASLEHPGITPTQLVDQFTNTQATDPETPKPQADPPNDDANP